MSRAPLCGESVRRREKRGGTAVLVWQPEVVFLEHLFKRVAEYFPRRNEIFHNNLIPFPFFYFATLASRKTVDAAARFSRN